MFCGRVAVEAILNLIGDMRDNLYRSTAKIAPSLLLKNRPVDFTGGNVGILTQAFVNEALIMPQV